MGEVKVAHFQLALFGVESYVERDHGTIASSYLRESQGPGREGFKVPAGSEGDVSFSAIKARRRISLKRTFRGSPMC